MIESFGILIPFLIADVLNPVLFAFMVYAAGTQRPGLRRTGCLPPGHAWASRCWRWWAGSSGLLMRWPGA